MQSFERVEMETADLRRIDAGWEQGKMYWSEQLQLQVNGTNGSDVRDELKRSGAHV